jgi:hypothetical protein
MIVSIGKSGKSFDGASKYLMHDIKAQTSNRVDWTLTVNCANDFVPAAVSEMIWTYRDAELLKKEAGVRAGGTAAQKPVKQLSLNWAISENPSQQHMIETAKDYLKHMGWDEHQAIFVAHNDKKYKHVHILLNEIHPETGLRLDDGLEKRRSQEWAVGYEQVHGIHCKQRLLNVRDREKSMSRDKWMEFSKPEREFDLAEQAFRAEFPERFVISDQWDNFKDIQRYEREAFYREGKNLFNSLRASVGLEVREEFRPRWADYYRAEKHFTAVDREILDHIKASIMDEQRTLLRSRRDDACAKLFKDRIVQREELKAQQSADRAEFRDRVATGIENSDFFHDLQQKVIDRQNARVAFCAAGKELSGHTTEPDHQEIEREAPSRYAEARDPVDAGKRGIGHAAGSFLDALFFDLTNLGSGSSPKDEKTDVGMRDVFEIAAEEATKRLQHEQQQSQDEEWRQRSKQSYGE